MPKKEIKTEVVKHGDGLAISLPKEFYKEVPIEEGTELTIIYQNKGNFEIRIENLIGKIQCEICQNRPGKYTCTKCGTIACSNCFWEWGNLCNKCINR